MGVPVEQRDGAIHGVLNKPLRYALKAVGITKRVTTHGLRRTFNTLAMEQASGELVRKVLGHADSAMTVHYLAPDIEQRRQLSTGVFNRVRKVEGKWKSGAGTDRKVSGEAET